MNSVYKVQYEKIKKYSEVLDIKNLDIIINILKLFYKTYHNKPNIVEIMNNQILIFLVLNINSNKFNNSEYKNISLDKIVIELFSWSDKELNTFYNMNTKNSKKYQYNLRFPNQSLSGGGMTNDYLLTYIKALLHKDNFAKTVYFFNNLHKLNEFNQNNNFLKNYLDINKIYINNKISYIDIEKLFLYLLQISNKKINEINKIFDYYYIKFSMKNKTIKIYNNDKFINNVVWICTKQKSDINNIYNFYKIFDNIKICISIHVLNNYIEKYVITAFYKKYDNLIVLDPYDKKFNYFSSKNKKLNNILINSKKDFEKTIDFTLFS